MTPMQRTLKFLKEDNIKHQVVERYFPRSKKYPFGCKQDFLNIIDVLTLDNGVVGIQVCGRDWMPHKRKIMHEERENTVAWLSEPGTRLEVWGWRKKKKVRGKKATYWSPRIAEVTIYKQELIWEEQS